MYQGGPYMNFGKLRYPPYTKAKAVEPTTPTQSEGSLHNNSSECRCLGGGFRSQGFRLLFHVSGLLGLAGLLVVASQA